MRRSVPHKTMNCRGHRWIVTPSSRQRDGARWRHVLTWIIVALLLTTGAQAGQAQVRPTSGIRPQTPRSHLQYRFAVPGLYKVTLDESTSGIGDVRLGFTLDLGPFNESAEAHYARRLRWQVTVTIEAATGGPDKLSGNGQTDLVAGLRVGSPFADPTDTD